MATVAPQNFGVKLAPSYLMKSVNLGVKTIDLGGDGGGGPLRQAVERRRTSQCRSEGVRGGGRFEVAVETPNRSVP